MYSGPEKRKRDDGHPIFAPISMVTSGDQNPFQVTVCAYFSFQPIEVLHVFIPWSCCKFDLYCHHPPPPVFDNDVDLLSATGRP